MADGKVGLFLFLFFLSNSIGFEQKIPCNDTLCSQNKTNTCFGYKQNLLNSSDKNLLLSLHTKLRENMTKEQIGILPKAFFMKKLTWNNDLAKMAQTWAEHCVGTKEPQPLLGKQPLGQLVIVTDQEVTKTLEDVLGKWIDGLKFLDPKIISKYKKPDSNVTNYEPVAQMIWWNTSQVGCGRSSYKLKDCNEKTKNCEVVQLVCNYFPPGNREGEPVYITTKDNHLICQYDNKNILCKNIGAVNTGLSKERGSSSKNRVRNRMVELWKASGTSSTSENFDVRSFYLFLLLTTFIF